jgi:hypothetical protein
LSDFNGSSAQEAVRKELAVAYAEGMRAAKGPGHVPLDEARLRLDGSVVNPDTQAFRDLARAWSAEADSLGLANRADEAARYGLANIEAGHVAGRGGVTLDALTSSAVEGCGTSDIIKIRRSLAFETTAMLVARLLQVDAARECAATIAQRDLACDRERRGWAARFALAIDAWLGARPTQWGEKLLDRSLKRRDVELRLLIADLAVRQYLHERGQAPGTLDELMPSYLPAVPIDPFSGKPLIYRVQDDGFVIYSVGPDGKDDGGRFGTYTQSLEAGFDRGLDFVAEPVE